MLLKSIPSYVLYCGGVIEMLLAVAGTWCWACFDAFWWDSVSDIKRVWAELALVSRLPILQATQFGRRATVTIPDLGEANSVSCCLEIKTNSEIFQCGFAS